MRVLPLLFAALLLAGCLDDPELYGRMDEARLMRDAALAEAANATSAAGASEERARILRAERDDAFGLLNVSHERLDARETALARAEAELANASAGAGELARLLAEAENATKDGTTLRELSEGLAAATAELARVREKYDDALAMRFDALTSIDRANVTWQFTDLRSDTHQWRYPMEDYRQDVKRVRPSENLYLPTEQGKLLRVPDPRPYLDAVPFRDVIVDLTYDRNERDFVREVFHLKRQLVEYSFALVDEKGYYKYPGETLVEGTGICGDTTILLASLLAAGKERAGYGFELALWIVEYDPALGRMIEHPESVNHGLIEVRFSDGETWFIETTSYEFYVHPQAYGWRYAWA